MNELPCSASFSDTLAVEADRLAALRAGDDDFARLVAALGQVAAQEICCEPAGRLGNSSG